MDEVTGSGTVPGMGTEQSPGPRTPRPADQLPRRVDADGVEVSLPGAGEDWTQAALERFGERPDRGARLKALTVCAGLLVMLLAPVLLLKTFL